MQCACNTKSSINIVNQQLSVYSKRKLIDSALHNCGYRFTLSYSDRQPCLSAALLSHHYSEWSEALHSHYLLHVYEQDFAESLQQDCLTYKIVMKVNLQRDTADIIYIGHLLAAPLHTKVHT